MTIVQGHTYFYSSNEDSAWLDPNNGLIVKAERQGDCPGCWEVSCVVSGKVFLVFDDELHGVSCSGTETIAQGELVTPRVPLARVMLGHVYKVEAVDADGQLDLYVGGRIVGPYNPACFKKVERR